MEYEIAAGASTEELETVVNEMIKEGWKPQGGVMSYTVNIHKAMVGNLASNQFIQAMIRERKK